MPKTPHKEKRVKKVYILLILWKDSSPPTIEWARSNANWYKANPYVQNILPATITYQLPKSNKKR